MGSADPLTAVALGNFVDGADNYCRHLFRHAGLAPTEFDPNVRLVRLSNNSPYLVTVTHQGATSAYGPSETTPFANVPLIGDWTLAVELPSGEGVSGVRRA